MTTGALSTIGVFFATMAVAACVETAAPLHAWSEWRRFHAAPNLTLTALTLASAAVLNGALMAALVWLDRRAFGLRHAVSLSPPVAGVLTVLVLDFSFYVGHVAMHAVPPFWRCHRVHHADPAVDVTTTLRQHPGESVIRYLFLGVFACAVGASPAAFAVYRTCSAVNALFEHADVRAPLWLDRALALVTTWPYLHKVHHSRRAAETNTNFGNLLSLFDRMFGTFTPSVRGVDVAYGLDGFDDRGTQTATGLLRLPWRDA